MRVGTGEEFLSSQCDERLVSLARAGHEPAFVAIVERYRPELHALARRLSSEGRGEDIVQQAFLSAFAALRIRDRGQASAGLALPDRAQRGGSSGVPGVRATRRNDRRRFGG